MPLLCAGLSQLQQLRKQTCPSGACMHLVLCQKTQPDVEVLSEFNYRSCLHAVVLLLGLRCCFPAGSCYMACAVRPTNIGNGLAKMNLQTGEVSTWHELGAITGGSCNQRS
jgi:hypothetical protein